MKSTKLIKSVLLQWKCITIFGTVSVSREVCGFSTLTNNFYLAIGSENMEYFWHNFDLSRGL
jgi:hypothetical protein